MHGLELSLYILFVVVLLLAQALALGALLFDQRARLSGARLLFDAQPVREAEVSEADLTSLPGPVARWLRFCGVLGRPIPRGVRLRQSGRFRLGKDKPWMPLRALQFYTLSPPQFLWFTRMRIGALPLIGGGDFFTDGHGHVSMRLCELIRLADSRGEKLDQGELLRYLSEIIWFPAAALSPAISWREIDAASAEASIRSGELSASAVFHFDAEGRVTSITAERYSGLGSSAQLMPWVTPIGEWREYEPGPGPGKVTLPYSGSALWRLPDGDFTYIELEILDIQYDPAEV